MPRCRLYFCPDCGGLMRPAPERLTETDIQIIRDYAGGLKTGEIAEKRFTSSKTVESQRREILRKTQTRNMSQCAVWADRQGLLQGGE